MKRRGRSNGMTLSAGRDTVRQIKLHYYIAFF